MSKNKTDKLSGNGLSVIFSNLAKAAEKQMDPEKSAAFSELSEKYWEGSGCGSDLQTLKVSIAGTLTEDYPAIQKKAEELGDRGVQRALRWGQKVTTLQKTLIDRFMSGGESIMEGKDLFICEACPSHAISLIFETYPQPKLKDPVLAESMISLLEKKCDQEVMAESIENTADNPAVIKLARALKRSCRILGEDCAREADYMIPQAVTVGKLLESLGIEGLD